MALDAFSPLCGADTPLYAVSLFWRFKLAEGLVGKQLEKQFEANNAALKLLLEAG